MNINRLENLKQFAKTASGHQWRQTDKVVIYTRVSTKDQADENTSLESQLRYCKSYAQKCGYEIVQYFGGTYESAKTDERKEFQQMLNFVKSSKQISSIIVYSYDRFSRSDNSSSLINQLKKHGVKVIAVTQPLDATSENGDFQQGLFLLFANFDNKQRRSKTITGMIENLRNGYWVGMAPFGYINKNRKEKARNHKYEITEQGKY